MDTPPEENINAGNATQINAGHAANINAAQAAHDSHDEIDLVQYWHVIWRRKWLILLVIGVVTSLAVAVPMYFMTPKYQSSTEILQRRMGIDKAFLGTDVFTDVSSQPDRDIQTAADLVKSPDVVAAVTSELGDRLNGAPADSMVSADVVNKVDLMDITATSTDPQLASDVANSFANNYITWRQSSDQAALTAARVPVENQINAIPIEQRGSPSYQALVDKLNSLKLAEAMQVGNLQIVKPAVPSTTAVSPKPTRNGLIGLITSVFLGIGLVFFMERFDTKIRSAGEVTARIDKPILTSVPHEPKLNGKGNIVTIAQPKAACAEAYRLLRTNLSFINPDSRARKIMVTSPGPVEGKSTTIANLAVTMAQSGKAVTILELDFRRPSLAKRLNLTGEIGVTNLLAGTHKLEDAIQVIAAEKLKVESGKAGEGITGQEGVKDIFCVTCGPIPPNPSELAASDAVGAIIDEAAGFSDFILIDTPPLGVVGDAASLAPRVDGTLLVVRMAKTDKKTFSNAQEVLRNMPGNLMGIVITDADAGGSYGYGYYGGYYKYGYS